MLDLIGATIQIQKPNPNGNGNQTVTVRAAFPEDPGQAADYLTQLLDHVTTSDATSFPGRININQASRTLLLAIPGMDETKVDAIMASREPEYSGQKTDQKYETWLYTESIVTLDEMKAIWPYITTGGSIYRAQIVGYFDEAGPSTRVEAIIDTSPPSSSSTASSSTTSSTDTTGSTGTSTDTTASSTTDNQSTDGTQATTGLPRIVFWRDLSNLGRGFPLETLGSDTSQ